VEIYLVATWGREECERRSVDELSDSYIMSWRKEADNMYARHSSYTRLELELTAAGNG
jgi:hypothetical protein